MRNEGPARLYVSRKQLVMVVTYSSSVTLPVWAASHQPVPLSNPGRAPKPSISLLTPLPSLSCMLFVSSSDPASSLLSSRLLHLPPPPVSPQTTPTASSISALALTSARRCLPKPQLWRGTAVHRQTPLICLSRVDTRSNVQLQNHFGPASNQSAVLTFTVGRRTESDGVSVRMKVTGHRGWNGEWTLAADCEDKTFVFYFAFDMFCITRSRAMQKSTSPWSCSTGERRRVWEDLTDTLQKKISI